MSTEREWDWVQCSSQCSRCGSPDARWVDWCKDCGPTLQCQSCDDMHHAEIDDELAAAADTFDWWKAQQL